MFDRTFLANSLAPLQGKTPVEDAERLQTNQKTNLKFLLTLLATDDPEIVGPCKELLEQLGEKTA